jgi:hypothetical protein
LYTAARTVSVTFCARSKSWSPSGNTCESKRPLFQDLWF